MMFQNSRNHCALWSFPDGKTYLLSVMPNTPKILRGISANTISRARGRMDRFKHDNVLSYSLLNLTNGLFFLVNI